MLIANSCFLTRVYFSIHSSVYTVRLLYGSPLPCLNPTKYLGSPSQTKPTHHQSKRTEDNPACVLHTVQAKPNTARHDLLIDSAQRYRVQYTLNPDSSYGWYGYTAGSPPARGENHRYVQPSQDLRQGWIG